MYLSTTKPRNSNNLKAILIMGMVAALLASPLAYGQDDADAVAEKMLDAIGGRAKWAALKNTINGSQQNRVTEPTVVYAVITMDFERPRFRIDTTSKDLHLIRVIDGDNSWRLRLNGNIEDVPADRFAEEMNWYAAHLYRTIHRVAARDPALSLSLADDGRLEVSTADRRILWIRLDAKNEPYAFGSNDNEIGSLSGPWDFVRDGIHHPRWVSNRDGTWRAAARSVEINVPLHDSMFVRPESE